MFQTDCNQSFFFIPSIIVCTNLFANFGISVSIFENISANLSMDSLSESFL